MTIRDKIVTASEAVALIRDGDTVVVEGFAGQCFAEELTLALEERFLQSGTPRDLTLAFAVAQGNRAGRGTDRLCYEGLLKRAIGGHWGMSVELGKMAVENKIEAYNLPQGVIAQLFRDTAAGKPGLITRVGVDTFVDPRNGGGKINDKTTEDLVELISIDGEDYLFYKAFKRLDVAFLRGTTADPTATSPWNVKHCSSNPWPSRPRCTIGLDSSSYRSSGSPMSRCSTPRTSRSPESSSTASLCPPPSTTPRPGEPNTLRR